MGLTGDELQSAIANAPLIGRVVGDTIQLTVAQAQNAHLVVSADAHLDPSTINLAAFTREPSTGDESAKVSDSVGVETAAVADRPISLMTPIYRHVAWLTPRTAGRVLPVRSGPIRQGPVSIPATVSLETSTDRSRWVWVTPYA